MPESSYEAVTHTTQNQNDDRRRHFLGRGRINITIDEGVIFVTSITYANMNRLAHRLSTYMMKNEVISLQCIAGVLLMLMVVAAAAVQRPPYPNPNDEI